MLDPFFLVRYNKTLHERVKHDLVVPPEPFKERTFRKAPYDKFVLHYGCPDAVQM